MNTLAISALLGLAAGAFAGPARAAQSAPAPAGVSGILLRATADPKSPQPALELELASAGPASAPELFRVLRDGGFECPIGDGRQFRLELRPDLEPVLLAALCRMPRPALFDHLKAIAADAKIDLGRAPALEVLAEVGRGTELDLAVRLADGGVIAAPPERRDAFERCARRILAREPVSAAQLESRFPELAPELACTWVRALGSLPRAAAIEPLAHLLARRPDADGWILSELASVAEGDPRSLLQEVPDSIRASLARADVHVVESAIRACRALEDAEAVPDLIGLIEAPDAQLAASAIGALRQIARVDFGSSSERWREWYEREAEWWRDHSVDAATMVRSRDASKASSAILALGRVRLYRHQAAEILCLGAERPESGLARMSCGALGDLASPRGVPALRAALRRPEPGVRDAALKSLQRLERAYGRR